MATRNLDRYRSTLDDASRQRYDEKCALIGNVDPYNLEKKKWSFDTSLWATVTYPDIVNFLLFSTSAYTMAQLKSYKSLEAYNQFINGWVRESAVYSVNNLCLHIAKVMHSQRLSDTPLTPWIVIQPEGKVLAAHCNCMAGLGESCTHIAALLFSIEATVKVRESKTVTDDKSYWLPASVKGISCSALKGIDFTSAKTKKRKLDSCLDGTAITSRTATNLRTVEKPSDAEFLSFLKDLRATGSKAAILTVKKDFQNDFVPAPLCSKFPMILNELYDSNFLTARFSEIIVKCKTYDIKVTQQEADAVENATKTQASSKLWHRFRSGRVTASKMYRVCHSSLSNPSVSLITSICYPEEAVFRTAATSWGCDHEEIARKAYIDAMNRCHDNFTLESAGFTINPDYPMIGATPDGLISCDCCGVGVLEIKCPYCLRHSSLENSTCLNDTSKGKELRTEHPYFYQVQTQMFVTRREFCDFVVWTEKEVHIERIEPNESFWDKISKQASDFHAFALMPEIVGRFYSRKDINSLPLSVRQCPPVSENSRHDKNKTVLFCICQQPEDPEREMVACDNENCLNQWFHLDCLKLKISSLPKGKWFCPDCNKSRKKTGKKKQLL